MGQQQSKGRHAENGTPDHPLAADAVADGTAGHRAHRRGQEEGEEVHLGLLQGQGELLHQVEGVEGLQAGHVEELGEHQGPQHQQGDRHLAPGQGVARVGPHTGAEAGYMVGRPVPDPAQHQHAGQGGEGEPGGAALAVGHDDEGRQQRAEGRAQVAADLEQGLGQARPSPCRHARHPGGFRVEDGRADTHQGGRQQHQAEAVGLAQQQQPHQGEAHAHGQGVGLGPMVGVQADQRLQQRGRELVGQGDQAHLGEGEHQVLLEHGVNRQQHRLHHVVEQVGETDGGDDGVGRGRHGQGAGRLARGAAGGGQGLFHEMPYQIKWLGGRGLRVGCCVLHELARYESLLPVG